MLSAAALVRAQKALERGYIGRMTVYEYAQTTDPLTHVTGATENAVLTDAPCRLSFSSSPAAAGEGAAELRQTVKVFYSPETEIRPGSKLIITQNGETVTYWHSGQEAVYATHREAVLELTERWA